MKMTWCGSWLAICDICHENQRIIGLEVDRMVIRNIVYIAYNLFCLPRNKLATKLVINFVTVIFFRVVASRYYNTCQCIPKLHRKTQLRRRTCVGMEINTNSHSTQNIRYRHNFNRMELRLPVQKKTGGSEVISAVLS